jgi:glucokinase
MYVGIDLGGTNIKAGVVTEDCRIIAQDSMPTGASRKDSEIIADMAFLAQKVTKAAGLSLSDIKSVGIGSPGSCDNKNGMLIYANNLNFRNTPMRAEFQKHWDIPVYIENDANCAALGEFSYLNDPAIDHFIAITLGTGVGGGVIINKKLYSGFNGAAAEIGHFQVMIDGEPCTCGRKGCWESYASITALIRMTKEKMAKCPDSKMHEFAQKEGKVSGRTAFDAAKAGDAAGKEVVDEYIKNVSEGLVSVINIFQPNKIVIGGAISKEGDYLLLPIREYVSHFVYSRDLPQTEISIAKLGNDAGLIGAAMLGK